MNLRNTIRICFEINNILLLVNTINKLHGWEIAPHWSGFEIICAFYLIYFDDVDLWIYYHNGFSIDVSVGTLKIWRQTLNQMKVTKSLINFSRIFFFPFHSIRSHKFCDTNQKKSKVLSQTFLWIECIQINFTTGFDSVHQSYFFEAPDFRAPVSRARNEIDIGLLDYVLVSNVSQFLCYFLCSFSISGSIIKKILYRKT